MAVRPGRPGGGHDSNSIAADTRCPATGIAAPTSRFAERCPDAEPDAPTDHARCLDGGYFPRPCPPHPAGGAERPAVRQATVHPSRLAAVRARLTARRVVVAAGSAENAA